VDIVLIKCSPHLKYLTQVGYHLEGWNALSLAARLCSMVQGYTDRQSEVAASTETATLPMQTEAPRASPEGAFATVSLFLNWMFLETKRVLESS
jgi:hypothetical protein